MRSASALPGLIAALLAGPALTQSLSDPQLSSDPQGEDRRAALLALLDLPLDTPDRLTQEALPGGAATVALTAGNDAFSQPSAGMTPDRLSRFDQGNDLFLKTWIAAPSKITGSDGLGPLSNARSCQACHIGDGRGHPPESVQDDRISMVLRLSVPGGPGPEGITDWIATAPDPDLGLQLQDYAAPGLAAEGQFDLTYSEIPVSLSGGEVATLLNPTYSVTPDPATAGLMLSPRVAQQMIGLGLLEAIPAADILALADPEDADGDGISGRAQIVPSLEYGQPMLGRFGHKARAPTIREQVAAALSVDMGLSTPLFPDPWGDCTETQTDCRAAPSGTEPGGFEVDAGMLDLLTFYSRNLGVPARRGADDPMVLAGREIFHATGCASCHQPGFVTQAVTDQPEQDAQIIWPYTDLLLHDMGPGLADNRPEGRATGSEWRTAPLWGIGLAANVSDQARFLHDGRARNVLEAILWHGGEAQAQRDAVAAMTTEDRAALIAFVESL